LRDRGEVGRDDSVVVFDCGIGQKYPPPPGLSEPPIVDPANLDLDALLARLGETRA
jgi:hypothetical protein